MPTLSLPERPHLGQLRKQARERQQADGTTLAVAQKALANDYGFASWPKLKRAVETLVAGLREPDLAPATGDPAADFLRLACLTYGNGDSPERRSHAQALLNDHPRLADSSLHVAAALGDAAAARRQLATGADPNAEAAPFQWPALLYLTYSRVITGSAAAALPLLLAAGADPNAGYLWHGFASPFTALTGVFGHGEQGPVNQPAHPECAVLAEQLLAAGADPNDSQAIYNCQFWPNNDHLRQLLRHGLGRGRGGPWHQRLDAALATPQMLLRDQLHWAVVHGFAERVALLADHGVDLTTPFGELHGGESNDARTPIALAQVNGHVAIVAELVRRGVAAPALSPEDAVVSALLAADRAAIAALPPEALAAVRTGRRGLIVWAAAKGKLHAVSLMLELGFDVNARGRGDGPSDEPWQTALHEAASNDNLALAQLLVTAGADPNIRDARFDASPLDWARHLDRSALVALLAPLTAPG